MPLSDVLSVFLIATIASCISLGSAYRIPPPTIVVHQPSGLKVSIPDENGIILFAFHGKVNERLEQNEVGTLYDDIQKAQDGRWTYQNNSVALKKGDKLHYWLYVQNEKLAYRLEDQVFEVMEFNTPTVIQIPEPVIIHERPQCEFSRTYVNGDHVCKSTLVFEENFDTLNGSIWTREVKFPKDTEDAEFCSYQDRPENSYIRDGKLFIVPSLQEEVPGFNESFIRRGKLDFGKRCTPSTILNNPIECERQAGVTQVVSPVVSAQLTTKNSFKFKYGKVVIRAKLPTGDWLFPEMFLKSSQNVFGDDNLVNGLMRVAFIHSNKQLQTEQGAETDGLYLRGQLVLDRSEANREKWMKVEIGQQHWGADFHEYSLTWTDEMISMAVDGKPYAHFRDKFCDKDHPCNIEHASLWESGSKLAPFDQEVYLVLGVGVGGLSDFPENCRTGPDRHPKPWRNTDPRAEKNFYNDKKSWYPTWQGEEAGLQVDWVKIYSL
ncbi:beta-1,3-glucan-binding protein-like [Phlebotomus argentipes]|uniref:beta-1,3-glucan-binding protein-like n=1 Tax=Phlebotomus argentipes TaxID=94469 RepID=UPI002892F2B9|nr:beta-1,3-glucan-binding protein-like [Phlebotomus argentipes]